MRADIAKFLPTATQGASFDIRVYNVGTIVPDTVNPDEGLGAELVESNIIRCNIGDLDSYLGGEGLVNFETTDGKQYFIYTL